MECPGDPARWNDVRSGSVTSGGPKSKRGGLAKERGVAFNRILIQYGIERVLFVNVDVGFGDQVTPKPSQVDFPALLDFPHPRIRAYPATTVVAEKFQAMVALGERNTRLKDFLTFCTCRHLLISMENRYFGQSTQPLNGGRLPCPQRYAERTTELCGVVESPLSNSTG